MKKEGVRLTEQELSVIEKLLSEIRYGSITIVVQDGRIVQIDKQEKIRLT
ncbi:MAG: YezD family protein [Clostridiales bacterium]|nr:YezD family protein [Clostridiales bacterium]